MPKANTDSQNYLERRSPENGGPTRITPEQQAILRRPMPVDRNRLQNPIVKKIVKRAFLKKALPYLVAGGTTGVGVSWAWQMILS